MCHWDFVRSIIEEREGTHCWLIKTSFQWFDALKTPQQWGILPTKVQKMFRLILQWCLWCDLTVSRSPQLVVIICIICLFAAHSITICWWVFCLEMIQFKRDISMLQEVTCDFKLWMSVAKNKNFLLKIFIKYPFLNQFTWNFSWIVILVVGLY